MSIIKGGAAGFKSVVFYSENFSSRAIRNKDGTITINVSKRKVAPKFESLINRLPFIRGLYLFVKPLIVMWKIYLMVFLPLLIFLLLASHSGKNSSGSSIPVFPIIVETIQNHFLLLIAIIMVIFGVVIKLSNLGKYHGAEHMTDTAYSTLSSLAISDVVKQSRIHAHCGTNFVVFVFVTYFILSFFISDLITLTMLSICLGYEVFLIQSKILAPFYWIGGFFQYTLFTSKPSIKHLEVAIASYEALIKAEHIKLA
ncbi:DUF1385 domain-containing protein [Alkalihalobacillus sp. 1P02AB]|uniref:DUF1385 domain-containing protein n=1 Tax=Alkalihalobacillus sp. 1P02AB TaxID=3132260 RepID=UPI0039A6C84F